MIKKSRLAPRIEYHHLALTNFTGNISFNMFGGGAGQDTLQAVPIFPPAHSVPVPADTLDNLIGNQHVLWMKIDTQGHDAVVLKGAEKTLSEGRVDVITFEVSPGLTPNYHEYVEIVEWLWK